jgi:glycine betaine catabolism B
MLKLKVFNYQTGEFQEQILHPESDSQGKYPGEYTIGRTANSDIVLISSDVSRNHGSIKVQNNQYYYTDLGSANGSRINNKELSAHQSTLLKPEDLIGIGDFVLLVADIGTAGQSSIERPSSNGKTALSQSQVSQSQSSQSQSSQSQPSQGQSQASSQASSQGASSHQLPYWNKGEFTVRCVRITDETADVKTFTFMADSPVLFDYKPGQFVTLDLEIKGEPISRSYSISSTPSRPHTLEITVKRVPAPTDQPDVPAGLVSNWLHDQLKVGSQIQINGAMGKFTCAPQPASKLLLISAGSGITPVMSMSRWLADTVSSSDTVFFHCARSPQDIIFRQELELMATRLPQFRLAISTTRPTAGLPWLGWMGRLDSAMLRAIAPDFQERTVYVCGPDSFMKAVKELFKELGFPMENYHQESFGAPKKVKSSSAQMSPAPPPVVQALSSNTEAANSTPIPVSSLTSTNSTTNSATTNSATKPSVCFIQSNKESAFEDAESILDLAEMEGVKIRSNCRQGVCGACKKRKIEGEVRYESEPEALEPSEMEAGYILTCVAAPVGRVVLEA